MLQFFSVKCVSDFRGTNPMMNAKAAQRLDGARKGEYLCQRCQSKFQYETGKLRCPVCSTQAAENLVPMYTENDPEKDEMLSRDEFGAGD